MVANESGDSPIHAYAMEVLERPREKRDAALAAVRVNAYAKAIVAGKAHRDASDEAVSIENQTRDLVNMIEASGGKSKGTD